MIAKKIAIDKRPETHDDITRLVEKLLYKADAVDIYPTPMSRLFDVAKITEVGSLPDPQSGFVKSLSQKALSVFLSAVQKIRGIADMRERVVYVPRRDHDPRILFAQGHELGHQTMIWHNVNRAYEDTDLTLSPSVKAIFEQEANFFSAETIFQGRRFARRARDYTVEFNSIFKLASDYGLQFRPQRGDTSKNKMILLPHCIITLIAFKLTISEIRLLRFGRSFHRQSSRSFAMTEFRCRPN